jgi:exodeoxyribonuclease VII small subunit
MNELKFEEALKKLEQIVAELEKGQLSLDESLKKYEEGKKLSSICARKLEEAEHKVEIVVKSEDGERKKAPFNTIREQE